MLKELKTYVDDLVVETIKTRGRAKFFGLAKSVVMLGIGALAASGVLTPDAQQSLLDHAEIYAGDTAAVLVGVSMLGLDWIRAHLMHTAVQQAAASPAGTPSDVKNLCAEAKEAETNEKQ